MPNHVTNRCKVIGPRPVVESFRNRMIIPDDGTGSHLEGLDRLPQPVITNLYEKMIVRPDNGGPQLRFDFDKIVPRPAILGEVEESNVSELGALLIIRRADTWSFAPWFLSEDSWVRADVGMPGEPMREVAAVFLEKHPEYEEAAQLRLKAIQETGYAGWHSWNLANWGVKGNASKFRLICEDPLEFLFDTPWEFPFPIFEALSRAYPPLKFHCLSFDELRIFAAEGFFNPAPGDQPYRCCAPSEDLYVRVYGQHSEPGHSPLIGTEKSASEAASAFSATVGPRKRAVIARNGRVDRSQDFIRKGAARNGAANRKVQEG